MTSLDRLRDLIFGMQEVPDPQGVWDYESHIRKATPGADVNLTAFVEQELEGLWDMHMGTVMRVFAERGHRELIPHMRGLLEDRDTRVQLDGALALLLVGADDGEQTFVETAGRCDPLDVADTLQEYGARIPQSVRRRLRS